MHCALTRNVPMAGAAFTRKPDTRFAGCARKAKFNAVSLYLAKHLVPDPTFRSKPALGTWKYENAALTMVEEGIPYKVDVLKLSKEEFRIKSSNPGEPVETR